MLMLSTEAWFEGIFTVGIFVFGLFLGVYFIYKSRKTKAKLLLYTGFLIFAASLTYLGVFLDFLSILLTGRNIDNTFGFQALITYMWTPFIVLFAINLGTELILHKQKIVIMIIYSFFSLIYELIIFMNPFNYLNSIAPEISGEALIHTNIILGTPLFFLMAFFMISIIIFVDLNLFLRGIKSEGVVRKKYLILSIGFAMYQGITTFDAFSYPGIFLVVIRGSIFVCFVIWYIGLREELIIPKKKLPKKEVIVEGSLFLLSELKPGEITEEEVTFFREQKICLVCKGKELGFTYICPKCEAFYCMKCAQALSNEENACWVCDEPFDKSKPTKPYKQIEEDKETLISEKDHKFFDKNKHSKKNP